MQSKASVAATDNGSLFDLIKQPLRRTSADNPKHWRKAETQLAEANPLMAFTNSPVPQAKVAPQQDGRVLPEWAITRPALQSVLEYTDQFGYRQRQHVVEHKRVERQDIELYLEIEDILKAGGSNIQLHVLVVATGLTLTRWSIGRVTADSIDCRLISPEDAVASAPDTLRDVA